MELGKLVGQAAVAASAQPGGSGRLVLLVDQSTGDKFLVDTGAVFSVIPFSSPDPTSGPKITTADASPIPCWGWHQRRLKAGGVWYPWKFLRAKVAFPILGADFLAAFDLLVDVRRRRLIRRNLPAISLEAPAGSSPYSKCGILPAAVAVDSSPSPSSAVDSSSAAAVDSSPLPAAVDSSSVAVDSSAAAVISSAPPAGTPPAVGKAKGTCALGVELEREFPSVFNAAKDLPPVIHRVQHHIETTGRPVAAKYRRLDPAKLKAAKEEFKEMERQGVIRRSSSNWASPLHMVKKTDGSWRPCGDFRQLNMQTVPDRYTCPNIGDLTARLAGCRFFSKLDLRKGYHQIPVRRQDIHKTAVITPFGLFEFLRMAFGLCNAGQTFQRMMDDVLAGLDFCFCYMDDILVASRSLKEHHEHLRIVLSRLKEHGLVLNAEKCEWAQASLSYLGHQVSASGVKPLASRVAAIRQFPLPPTVQLLQTYLGMVNFYRRFLQGAAEVLKPLTDCLKGGAKGQLTWTADMRSAFEKSKLAMLNAAELAHPEETAELSLEVDASGTHVGAVLHQHTGGGRRPLGFFSVKLNSAQQKYSAFDRELLACYLGIRHFRWLLEGRPFYVLTDHKPLTFALRRLSDHWTARQQRHLSFISEFTADLRHVAGKENVVADALSRPAAAVAPAPRGQVDFAQLAKAQESCSEVLEMRTKGSLAVERVEVAGVPLWCDTSSAQLRPLVPLEHRKTVFEAVHGLAHPGIRATKRMVTSRFVWPGCSSDVAEWCRNCSGCARGKVTVQEKTPVEKIQLPAAKFAHVHVDLVGPLPVSAGGHTHLLTVVDRLTRWPEAIPMRCTTAEACADAFALHWVARYGVPHSITTDRGAQFTSAVWKCLCCKLGAKHILTTAYHPQSNGMVERFHRQLKQSLKARDCGSAWLDHLPWVLLGLRAAPKEDSAVSSAEAVFGSTLTIPSQAQEIVSGHLPSADPPLISLRQRSYAEVASGHNSLLDGATHVYIRRGAMGGPFSSSYSGPYRVLQREKKILLLQLGDRQEWVSADRLKPHAGGAPVEALPPKRGRPLGSSGGGSPSPSVPD